MSYAGAEVQRFEQERVALVAEVAALQATLRETAQERDECKARVAAMEQESLGAYADRVVLERLRAAEATLRAAQGLAEKWSDSAGWEYNHGDRGFASGLDQCANELEAALGSSPAAKLEE